MSDYYILDGHEVKECDLMTWAKWFGKADRGDRKVARETIGDSEISTVFLGLDHSFGGGSPLLFETMVFGGKLDGEMDRYSTWNEAVLGHKAMAERVEEGGDKHE